MARSSPEDDGIVVVGASSHPLRDAYHSLLSMRWHGVLIVIALLVRDRSPALNRSWTVMHRIDDTSPLHGLTPADLEEGEVEIAASVVGTDDTSLQPVHARYRYESKNILWGARLADILSERADGQLELDVSRFDEIVESQPTETFPYAKGA